MNQKSATILITLIYVFTVFSATLQPTAAAGTTKISVEPTATTITVVGETFQINISITDVTDLYGWQFSLYYRNAILNASSIVEGPFLKTGGGTFFQVLEFNDAYNATHGRIVATCSLTGKIPGVNGNGTLATITFKAIAPGNSTLHLSNTVLGDSHAQSIPHTTIDGWVTVPYDVIIKAYCYTQGTYVSVSITMDGTPTGFNTPYTFTGLTGAHTFTVPSNDLQGHPFKRWSTGETSTTITVNSAETYTAYYGETPPVGDAWIPVDKLALLAPYIALASTILVATAATAIYVKHVKRRKKKQ